MLLELLLRGKRHAVDPLEHLVLFVPPPVGAGDGEKLDRLDPACRRDVRAEAEVGEIPLVVECDLLPLQSVEELKLVLVPLLLEIRDRVVPGFHLAAVRDVASRTAPHFLFDLARDRRP